MPLLNNVIALGAWTIKGDLFTTKFLWHRSDGKFNNFGICLLGRPPKSKATMHVVRKLHKNFWLQGIIYEQELNA